MSKIFISYRRGDSQDVTGRIYDRLEKQFGKSNIFKDVDSIPLGVDFRKHLSQVVSQCQIVLAVIGAQWLDAKNDAGQKRLDAPSDFVRIEIEAALARGIPVIPVLVCHTAMPAESDLPPSLAPLSYRNGISVRADPDFHRDMDRLNAALHDLLRSQPSPAGLPLEQPVSPARPGEAAPAPVPEVTPPLTDVEPTTADLEAAQSAIRQVAANANPSVAFRQFHTACGGRVIPALARIMKQTTTPRAPEPALKLLALAVRQPEARPFMPLGLDLIVDYGILDQNVFVQQAAIDNLVQAACPPREKWTRLFSCLPLADERSLGKIIGQMLQITPATERQSTGAAVVQVLARTSEPNAFEAACRAIQALGYRAAVPQLISLLEIASSLRAEGLANVLVSWRIMEAAPALRQAIDNARYGLSHELPKLLTNLYTLEGAVCAPYLADVLRDALPCVQTKILNNGLVAANEDVILDAAAELLQSTEENVQKQARSFLRAKGRP